MITHLLQHVHCRNALRKMMGGFLLGLVGMAHAAAPSTGIQEIVGNAFNGQANQILRPCAFWANDAAAAVRRREQGIPEGDAAAKVGMPNSLRRPTDADSDFYSRRVEIVAQVYAANDLQKMTPKQMHDAVFFYCREVERH